MKFILLTMIIATSIIQNVDAKVPRFYKSKNIFSIKQTQLIKEFQINPEFIVKLKSGDSTDKIENGDILAIDNNDELFVAVRDINDELTIEILTSDFELDPEFKRPCIYNGKLYAHGQVIAVDPGLFLNYRGFPVMLRPGKMLVCRDGVLHDYEIRPRY